MADVNKVILVGRLGKDPEVRTFQSGDKVASVSLATGERWNDRNTGETREQTHWHTLVFKNRLAEIVEQYLHKGSQIYAEGSIKYRKWQDQSGQDRYATEIHVHNMQMLGSPQERTQSQQQANGQANQYGNQQPNQYGTAQPTGYGAPQPNPNAQLVNDEPMPF